MSLTGDLVYPNYQKDLTQPDQLHRDTHIGIAVRADACNKCAADICRTRCSIFGRAHVLQPTRASGSGVQCSRYTGHRQHDTDILGRVVGAKLQLILTAPEGFFSLAKRGYL